MWCGLGTSGFFFCSRMGKNTTPGIFSQYSTTGWDTARDKQRLPEKIGRITRFALNQWGCDNLILYNSHLIYLFFFSTRAAFSQPQNIYIYYINTNEIPGELSRENLVSSQVKITCYLHMWKYHLCYGYIINRAFTPKNYSSEMVWYFIGV